MEGPAIKLHAIIGDEGVRYSKFGNYILLHEIFNINVPNVSSASASAHLVR